MFSSGFMANHDFFAGQIKQKSKKLLPRLLCKDIFVTSRSTRGPLSLGPISLGPLFSPKLRGDCIRGLSRYAFRGNPSTAARKYIALAVCHRSRPLRAACGLLLSPARAFANSVIQPLASYFYRQPLRVHTCLTWVRQLLRNRASRWLLAGNDI